MAALLTPKRIGILGFNGITALDLTGPSEAFCVANGSLARKTKAPGYEIVVLGVGSRKFVAGSGLEFKAHALLASAPLIHTLIVPGGEGLRQPKVNNQVVEWIHSRAEETKRIASICTGIYGLAPTGLLDGCRVTTHWRFTADVSRRFPKLRVAPDALFVREGKYYTSAGITAGIDLALALIEEDFGRQVALEAARDLVVYLNDREVSNSTLSRSSTKLRLSTGSPISLPGCQVICRRRFRWRPWRAVPACPNDISDENFTGQWDCPQPLLSKISGWQKPNAVSRKAEKQLKPWLLQSVTRAATYSGWHFTVVSDCNRKNIAAGSERIDSLPNRLL